MMAGAPWVRNVRWGGTKARPPTFCRFFLQLFDDTGDQIDCCYSQPSLTNVFIHLPLIKREEEWRDVAGRGVRRQGDR
jgi:hypothetical protein